MILQIIGAISISIGVVFLFLGALGILRMPDMYNRIQAGTKATTFGSIFTILGAGIYYPPFLAKAIILVIFILMTNPISSHAISRRAYYKGVTMTEETEIDELKGDRGD